MCKSPGVLTKKLYLQCSIGHGTVLKQIKMERKRNLVQYCNRKTDLRMIENTLMCCQYSSGRNLLGKYILSKTFNLQPLTDHFIAVCLLKIRKKQGMIDLYYNNKTTDLKMIMKLGY